MPQCVTFAGCVISVLAENKLVVASFFQQSLLSSSSSSACAGFEGDECRSEIRSKKALSILAKRILYILVSLCGIDTGNTTKQFR